MLKGLFLTCIVTALWISPWTSASAQLRANPLDSVVGVTAAIRSDARTRARLGREREGTAIVIDDAGLVLTIGFLILEAESVDVQTRSGQLLPAEILAYHGETGLGLLRVRGEIDAKAVQMGDSDELRGGEGLIVGAFGGKEAVQQVFVTDRRTFTGPWEYLLEEAIFTAPGHPSVAGAGLFNSNGELVGIGYLTVAQRLARGGVVPGNMFVPIGALMPVFGDLIATGKSPGPARPWLGLYLEEAHGRLFVERTADGGPAAEAGLAVNDLVLGINGVATGDREAFYHELWAAGEAGDAVTLNVLKGMEVRAVPLTSMDRYNWYKTTGRSY